jgi:ketosteroid isomerase-like protein
VSDQANVELVNAWFAALGSGDTRAAANLMSDDAVWHTGGRGRFAGDFEGKEARRTHRNSTLRPNDPPISAHMRYLPLSNLGAG